MMQSVWTVADDNADDDDADDDDADDAQCLDCGCHSLISNQTTSIS